MDWKWPLLIVLIYITVKYARWLFTPPPGRRFYRPWPPPPFDQIAVQRKRPEPAAPPVAARRPGGLLDAIQDAYIFWVTVAFIAFVILWLATR